MPETNSITFDIFSLVYFLIGCLFGYVSGIYLPIKFRKEDRKPKISVSRFQEVANYFIITNHGGDLLDMNIEISWMQDGEEQSRMLDNFFNESDNPLRGSPHHCSSLRYQESKKVIDCPRYSENQVVDVFIKGKNLDGDIYDEKFVVKVDAKKR